jgi:4'-phosphopantetheinyl transferase
MWNGSWLTCTRMRSVIFKNFTLECFSIGSNGNGPRGERGSVEMALDPDPERMLLQNLDGILPADEVHLWRADLSFPKNGLDTLRELLVPEDHDRAARFEQPGLRNQFLFTRAFLRQTLGRYLQVEARELQFRTTRYGKPEISNSPDIQFNLSHSGKVAVLAIVRGRRVGVDVEQIRGNVDPMELASRFFSPREIGWLQAQPDSERLSSFFVCWTAKEAYLKARGEGLTTPLSSFGLVPSEGNSRLELEFYDDPKESRRWSICRLSLGPDLRGAVAVEGTHCRICLGTWQPEIPS